MFLKHYWTCFCFNITIEVSTSTQSTCKIIVLYILKSGREERNYWILIVPPSSLYNKGEWIQVMVSANCMWTWQSTVFNKWLCFASAQSRKQCCPTAHIATRMDYLIHRFTSLNTFWFPAFQNIIYSVTSLMRLLYKETKKEGSQGSYTVNRMYTEIMCVCVCVWVSNKFFETRTVLHSISKRLKYTDSYN
jgi:hypothetical protein